MSPRYKINSPKGFSFVINVPEGKELTQDIVKKAENAFLTQETEKRISQRTATEIPIDKMELSDILPVPPTPEKGLNISGVQIPGQPISTGILSKAFSPDLAKHIKRIVGITEREEAAISGGIREGLPGIKKGLTGEKLTQMGDIFREKGVPEDKAAALGFATSLASPLNLALTGGTGGGAKSLISKTARAIPKSGGKFLRSLTDISSQGLRPLREIVNKRGKDFVFNKAVESPEFVGKHLTPIVEESLKNRALSFDKMAIKGVRANIKDEVIDNAIKTKNKYGLEKIPTIKEADDFFKKTVSEIPDDFALSLKSTKTKLGSVLRREGIIDEFGKLKRGIGKDNPVVNNLISIYSDLQKRIKLNRPKRLKDLVTQQSQKQLKEATEYSDVLGKADYVRTRGNLNSLITGDKTKDRLVYEMIDALDDAAIESGAKNLDKAKGIFKVSRQLEKVWNKTSDIGFGERVQSLLQRAGNTKNEQTRDLVRKILPKEQADEVIDALTAHGVLFDPKGLADTGGKGFFSILGRGFKKGIRSFEEKIRPTATKIGKRIKKPIRAVETGLSLAERKALSNLAQGNQ